VRRSADASSVTHRLLPLRSRRRRLELHAAPTVLRATRGDGPSIELRQRCLRVPRARDHLAVRVSVALRRRSALLRQRHADAATRMQLRLGPPRARLHVRLRVRSHVAIHRLRDGLRVPQRKDVHAAQIGRHAGRLLQVSAAQTMMLRIRPGT
jgi:hypothetical protein